MGLLKRFIAGGGHPTEGTVAVYSGIAFSGLLSYFFEKRTSLSLLMFHTPHGLLAVWLAVHCEILSRQGCLITHFFNPE